MLTDTAIRALKPGAKEFKKSDTGGLHLLIKPSGAKLWRLAYRFDNKQKTLVGGRYPFVGLADARVWRDSAKGQLAQGIDPREAQLAQEEEARAASEHTFEKLAQAWLKNIRPQWSERYADLVTGRFEDDLFPEIGELPIADIDGPTLRAALKKMEDRGAIEFARRMRAHSIFRWKTNDLERRPRAAL